MNIKRWKVMLAVDDYGSFTRAGEVLGYTQSEAAQAVAKLDGSLSTEELIRGALKSMASRF